MNTGSKDKLLGVNSSRPATAEQRRRELGIKLPTPPAPFGIYAEAVQTGNLLFLTGMLPTIGREAKYIGRIGAELDVQTGREAAYLAALNGLAVARQHLGSLDKVTRIVRLGVLVATSGDVREQPKIADGASELLQDVFGKNKNPGSAQRPRCHAAAFGIARRSYADRPARRVGGHFRRCPGAAENRRRRFRVAAGHL